VRKINQGVKIEYINLKDLSKEPVERVEVKKGKR
jgi:hypothetical protein